MREYNIKHLFATLRILKGQNPEGFKCLNLEDIFCKVVWEAEATHVSLVYDLFNEIVTGGINGDR